MNVASIVHVRARAMTGAMVALLVLAAVVVLVRFVSHDDSAVKTIGSGEQQSTTTSSPTPNSPQPEPPPISENSIAAIRAQGTLIIPLGPGEPASPIGLEKARTVAAQELGFIEHAPVAEASRGLVTVTDFGREQIQKNRITSTVTPIINERLAWVVVYTDVSVPIFGPITSGGNSASDPPASYTSKLFVCIDATTGDFLSAESF